MNRVNVSFIIVNYNNKDITLRCIESIKNKLPENEYEIVVVDNNSDDGSQQIFSQLEKEKFNLKCVCNDKNYGFGKANNIGFRHTKGEYLYLLNNDARLETENISKIVPRIFSQYHNVGILATKVRYPNGKLQPNTQKFTDLKVAILRLLKAGEIVRNNRVLLRVLKLFPLKLSFVDFYLRNLEKEREEEYVDWASGCSLIFKREVYEELNGFDENFFMYGEDEDICLRARKKGYRVLFTPEIVVVHFVGASGEKQKKDFLIKVKVESEFYFFKKNLPNSYKKLKMIYKFISFLLTPFSSRFSVIRKAIKEIEI